MSVKGAIGIAIGALLAIVVVALVAIVAYALLTGEDGSESQVAPPSVPTSVATETETEAERRTRLCEAALQGGDKYAIFLFCTEPGSPTPAPPTPGSSWREWCWERKALIAYKQIRLDYDKNYGFDYRQQEENLVEFQRSFEANCGQYSVVPVRSANLDHQCRTARNTEYRWRQNNVDSYWTSKLENWQKEYCQ